jgi:hypothetical protein
VWVCRIKRTAVENPNKRVVKLSDSVKDTGSTPVASTNLESLGLGRSVAELPVYEPATAHLAAMESRRRRR